MNNNILRPLAWFLVTIVSSTIFIACDEGAQRSAKMDEADSLMYDAYQKRDYARLMELSEELNAAGRLSDMKTYYWRGYACQRQRYIRTAETWLKKAIGLEVRTVSDLEYYSKSATRLASMLLLKCDYEGTLGVVMPALQKMREVNYDSNSDYAFLLTAVGTCQLKLGKQQEAADNYAQAYQKHLQVIRFDSNIGNYNSAIVGVITTTDNYLSSKCYQEARIWTDRFETLLQQYEQHPQANATFIDKQRARLNLYRACALEGLGLTKEAAKAYDAALKTQYAKTSDGLLEATSYLALAKRWKEAADNFHVLDDLIQKYIGELTLDNIQQYLLPKFRANMGANRTDSAFAVSSRICNVLDSVITLQKRDDAAELATIYETQTKDTKIAQQQADLDRQRMLAMFVALVLFVAFATVFMYFRHRAAQRLGMAYRQLEEANQQLEEKNNLLTVANERAEESSRMKTNFIQQISHEIRTPLNILSGFTQIITTPGMELDDATKQDINRQIGDNTNRITGLVNKMLELSDASSKAVIERTDTVPAIQIAAQAAEDSGIGQAQHLTFDMQIGKEAEEAMLTTNLSQATRALVLLLDNAQKFTHPAEAHQQNSTDAGGRQQKVLLGVNVQDGKVLFAVEDTGIGVPPEQAEHIFDEFVQLDEYYDGTGIGLTVARSIARRLGGDIQLDTTYLASLPSGSEGKGSGARFVMWLPLQD